VTVARLASALAVVMAIAAALVAPARAADECAGLMVCLPVEGPWVVIPPGTGAAAGRVDYDLACPRRGYVVAGTDVRISDRQVDVGIRGETGSPVGPGTTTRESVLFSGLYAGRDRRPTAFKPFVGCMPTSGGGARNQTSRASQHDGLKPTRPVVRLVVNRKLAAGASRVVARCPGSSRIVGSGHAVGFRVAEVPGESILRSVATASRPVANGIAVTARVGAAARAGNPELQVLALCTRTAP
jgi:hypothetical protein